MQEAEASRLFPMVFLLLLCLPDSAQASVKPVVSVEREDSHFRIHASIVLPVAPCLAYRLLTDYKSLPSYIPGMLQVRDKRISDNRVNVWQEGEVEVLFFRVQLASSLEIEEIPDRRIVFKQVDGDLESYSGEWNLLKTQEGTQVRYSAALSLKPDYFMPAFLARKVLENEVGKRFEAIAIESSARKSKTLSECGPEK